MPRHQWAFWPKHMMLLLRITGCTATNFRNDA
jgi:hypothetical protein